MEDNEIEVEEASQQVYEGAGLLVSQRLLVTKLPEGSKAATSALELLSNIETAQLDREKRLKRLKTFSVSGPSTMWR